MTGFLRLREGLLPVAEYVSIGLALGEGLYGSVRSAYSKTVLLQDIQGRSASSVVHCVENDTCC